MARSRARFRLVAPCPTAPARRGRRPHVHHPGRHGSGLSSYGRGEADRRWHAVPGVSIPAGAAPRSLLPRGPEPPPTVLVPTGGQQATGHCQGHESISSPNTSSSPSVPLSPFFPFSLPSPTHSISPSPLTQAFRTKRTGKPPTLYNLGRGLRPLGIRVFVSRSRKLEHGLGTEPQTDLVDVLTQSPTVLPAHVGWWLGAPTNPGLHSPSCPTTKISSNCIFLFLSCCLPSFLPPSCLFPKNCRYWSQTTAFETLFLTSSMKLNLVRLSLLKS